MKIVVNNDGKLLLSFRRWRPVVVSSVCVILAIYVVFIDASAASLTCSWSKNPAASLCSLDKLTLSSGSQTMSFLVPTFPNNVVSHFPVADLLDAEIVTKEDKSRHSQKFTVWLRLAPPHKDVRFYSFHDDLSSAQSSQAKIRDFIREVRKLNSLETDPNNNQAAAASARPVHILPPHLIITIDYSYWDEIALVSILLVLAVAVLYMRALETITLKNDSSNFLLQRRNLVHLTRDIVSFPLPYITQCDEVVFKPRRGTAGAQYGLSLSTIKKPVPLCMGVGFTRDQDRATQVRETINTWLKRVKSTNPYASSYSSSTQPMPRVGGKEIGIAQAIENEMRRRHRASTGETELTSLSSHSSISCGDAAPAYDDNEIPASLAAWLVQPDDVQIGPEIGRGFFGIVHRGTWRGQQVAIKQLYRAMPAAAATLFAREIGIVSALRSPYIVLFMGVCFGSDTYLLTEFMERGALHDVLTDDAGTHSSGPLPPPPEHLLLDIARGMHFLHTHSPPIVHRDLTSFNILVDRAWHCKVSDFGQSRLKDQASAGMTAQPGNLRWMAPECFRRGSYDERVDVFSFALIIWEVITHQVPLAHLEPAQAAASMAYESLRPTIPTDCSPLLRELMEQCWQDDYTLRPSFGEIVRRLESSCFETPGPPVPQQQQQPDSTYAPFPEPRS